MVLIAFGLICMIAGLSIGLPTEDMKRIISGIILAWVGLGCIILAGRRS